MKALNRLPLIAMAAVVGIFMVPMLTQEGVQAAGPAAPLTFNRLLKKDEERQLPPLQDGIHDPEGQGGALLQPPAEALAGLPEGKGGNYVDWVKALEGGKIKPRYDRLDPKVEAVIMDLDIVREVKGSMPDVVYPHRQHTEWLDCSNCHPAIFIPQKGANQISMAAILLGQKCGVCHGKVAFPVSAQTCRRCHSKAKGQPAAAKKTAKAAAPAPAKASAKPAKAGSNLGIP